MTTTEADGASEEVITLEDAARGLDYYNHYEHADVVREASDHIASLEAENERLRTAARELVGSLEDPYLLVGPSAEKAAEELRQALDSEEGLMEARERVRRFKAFVTAVRGALKGEPNPADGSAYPMHVCEGDLRTLEWAAARLEGEGEEVVAEVVEEARPKLRNGTIGQIEEEVVRATGNGELAAYTARWLDDPVALIRTGERTLT